LLSYIKTEYLLAGLFVSLLTFFVALIMNVGAQVLVSVLNNIYVALILLLVIIMLGIIFDLVGTAATSADISPFNAMAARKVTGAHIAVSLTQKADVVANFCLDVVGDVAGTLSGAIGAGIVISLIDKFSFLDMVLAGSVMTSLIAGLTVGGKAIGKKFALSHANAIIYRVALLLSWWEKLAIWRARRKRR